jgi:peptide chain release factor 2
MSVNIKPEDVKCELYSPNRIGGFSNKTPSGVKLTHIPTGITSSCDSERSQFRNHYSAFAELEKKLLANEALEKMAENARELGLDYDY